MRSGHPGQQNQKREYTNLGEGEYSFMVQARNAFKQESEIESFSFVISPPWYNTFLVKIGFLILVLISLGAFMMTVSKREKKKREILKSEQTKQLEKKESEFKKEVEKSESEIMKLNNEKLQIDIKHKNSQLASATMHLVQKGEILAKLKDDLNSLLTNASTENKRKNSANHQSY